MCVCVCVCVCVLKKLSKIAEKTHRIIGIRRINYCKNHEQPKCEQTTDNNSK